MNRPPGLSPLLALAVTLACSPCHGAAPGAALPRPWPPPGRHRPTQRGTTLPGHRSGGLRPDTAYRYRVWAHSERLDTAPSTAREGGVRTPPLPSQPAKVRFDWGGDLADAQRWFNFGELSIGADGRLLYEGVHRPR